MGKNQYTIYGADGSVLQSEVLGGYYTVTVAGVAGDSGGGVLDASGTPRDGLGIISQGHPSYQISCANTTYASDPGDDCYSRIYWIGLVATLDAYGLTLK